jgi:hypothetical protein
LELLVGVRLTCIQASKIDSTGYLNDQVLAAETSKAGS